MPITSNKQLGRNKNGSVNVDYCKYCYENGEFIDKVTMEEYIEMCSKEGSQAGISNEEMKEHCTKLFPTLKRWKCTCTNDVLVVIILIVLVKIQNVIVEKNSKITSYHNIEVSHIL